MADGPFTLRQSRTTSGGGISGQEHDFGSSSDRKIVVAVDLYVEV